MPCIRVHFGVSFFWSSPQMTKLRHFLLLVALSLLPGTECSARSLVTRPFLASCTGPTGLCGFVSQGAGIPDLLRQGLNKGAINKGALPVLGLPLGPSSHARNGANLLCLQMDRGMGGGFQGKSKDVGGAAARTRNGAKQAGMLFWASSSTQEAINIEDAQAISGQMWPAEVKGRLPLVQESGSSSPSSGGRSRSQSPTSSSRGRVGGNSPVPKAVARQQAADMVRMRFLEKQALREGQPLPPSAPPANIQLSRSSDVVDGAERDMPSQSKPTIAARAYEGGIRIPRNLTSYTTLPQLLDLLDPFSSGASGHHVTAADAVGAMNRIKRLSRKGSQYSPVAIRAEAQMQSFAAFAIVGMEEMNGKNVGLVVNAVCGRGKSFLPLMKAAAKRAAKLAEGQYTHEGSLDVQAISMVLNGFARSYQRDEKLFQTLSGFIQRSADNARFMSQFNSQAVSVVVNAFAKLGVRDHELFSALSKVAQSIPPGDYSSQAVANILNAFARQGSHDDKLFLYLGEVAMMMDPWAFQSQHIAIIVNAFAKAGARNDRLFSFFASEVRLRDESSFDLQAVANIVNAYARSYGGDADRGMFQHFGRIVRRMPARDYDATNLASILNSFVKVNQSDTALFAHTSKALQRLDPLLFDAQAVSNIVHSFAKADIHDHSLFAAMSRIACSMEYMFEGQSVALILNAYSRTDHRDDNLMAHMSQVARRITADGFDRQHVENILNAFARMEYRDQDLCEHLAGITMQMEASNFDPQAIAIVLNSFAKLMPQDPLTIQIFNFFSNEVLPKQPLAAFDATAISIILNAFAKVEVRDEKVFSLLAEAAVGLEDEGFDAHNIANMFHAFASLDIRDVPTIGRLIDILVHHNVAAMRPEEVAVIAWSSAVLRLVDVRLVDFLLTGIDMHLGVMESNFLRQTHQFLLTCELEGLLDIHAVHVQGGYAADVIHLRSRASPLQVVDYLGSELGACREAFCSLAPESTRTSRLQVEVGRVLESMGLSVEEEYVDSRSGYSIDIKVDIPAGSGYGPGGSIALEVDGPSHYAVGTRIRLGRTVMKHRHMAQLGLNVRTLPYWEWDVLKTKGEKERYLKSLIMETPAVTETELNTPQVTES